MKIKEPKDKNGKYRPYPEHPSPDYSWRHVSEEELKNCSMHHCILEFTTYKGYFEWHTTTGRFIPHCTTNK